jgi:predicted flap endonuclease-1-like 5' DNA nuclease
MPVLIEAYWPYIAIAFAIGVAVAWFVFVANRKTSVVTERKDVLDEGAERAARNQALIDAPGATRGEPEAAPASAQSGDDLTRIKGLGPKIATILQAQGITEYAQIAAWDDAEIDRIDALLDRFAGRIHRDSWVDQAKLLSSGDEAGFVQKFGKNG